MQIFLERLFRASINSQSGVCTCRVCVCVCVWSKEVNKQTFCLLYSYQLSPSWTLLPPHTVPLSHPSAPAPSIQYHASNLDWQLISYMIVYMFQCHSPKSSHPLWMLSFKPTVWLSSFTFIKRLFSFSLLSAIGWCHLHIWDYWYFSQQSWFQLVLHPAWHFSWCLLHVS